MTKVTIDDINDAMMRSILGPDLAANVPDGSPCEAQVAYATARTAGWVEVARPALPDMDALMRNILEIRETAVSAVIARDGVVPMEWMTRPVEGFGAEVQELFASGVPVFRLSLRFEGYVFKVSGEWLVPGYA